jgi:hypothetical protein
MIDALGILLILRLELGFASLSISPRKDIRHQLIVLAKLGESL